MQSPVNLDIWNRSIELAVRADRLAAKISGIRMPGTASQVRRASSSIPANIAEGAGQLYPAKCAHFIGIAIASVYELESHLILTKRLEPELRGVEATLDELQQIRRMMYSYQKYKLRQSATRVQPSAPQRDLPRRSARAQKRHGTPAPLHPVAVPPPCNPDDVQLPPAVPISCG